MGVRQHLRQQTRCFHLDMFIMINLLSRYHDFNNYTKSFGLYRQIVSSLELQCKNNAFYIFVYVLANSPLATRGSEQKKLLLLIRQIPGVGGWIIKKLIAMQAKVLNLLLVNKLLNDDENQRPQTSYICNSFFSVSFSNPCLVDHLCLAEILYLANIPCFADNLLLSWFLPS